MGSRVNTQGHAEVSLLVGTSVDLTSGWQVSTCGTSILCHVRVAPQLPRSQPCCPALLSLSRATLGLAHMVVTPVVGQLVPGRLGP